MKRVAKVGFYTLWCQNRNKQALALANTHTQTHTVIWFVSKFSMVENFETILRCEQFDFLVSYRKISKFTKITPRSFAPNPFSTGSFHSSIHRSTMSSYTHAKNFQKQHNFLQVTNVNMMRWYNIILAYALLNTHTLYISHFYLALMYLIFIHIKSRCLSSHLKHTYKHTQAMCRHNNWKSQTYWTCLTRTLKFD